MVVVGVQQEAEEGHKMNRSNNSKVRVCSAACVWEVRCMYAVQSKVVAGVHGGVFCARCSCMQ